MVHCRGSTRHAAEWRWLLHATPPRPDLLGCTRLNIWTIPDARRVTLRGDDEKARDQYQHGEMVWFLCARPQRMAFQHTNCSTKTPRIVVPPRAAREGLNGPPEALSVPVCLPSSPFFLLRPRQPTTGRRDRHGGLRPSCRPPTGLSRDPMTGQERARHTNREAPAMGAWQRWLVDARSREAQQSRVLSQAGFMQHVSYEHTSPKTDGVISLQPVFLLLATATFPKCQVALLRNCALTYKTECMASSLDLPGVAL
ncbi:hypothetical protein GGTG_08864 [Gaeumannomyces tritici R3-111a-1]|uniref:Uncharacterized protein n=1 Tax=Gaeumannomyces tritici (strain R3-111a-1) TaxID=644352 RepID=J3P5S4_GAET3|nr:hypothetical protein GGTG_08864 [Gaeumannomyces tritici R3-111a-1]EJT75026.1 hypothetical protein GGTG_08864 [Gaeumannomyces tritici R3-111a-1]